MWGCFCTQEVSLRCRGKFKRLRQYAKVAVLAQAVRAPRQRVIHECAQHADVFLDRHEQGLGCAGERFGALGEDHDGGASGKADGG